MQETNIHAIEKSGVKKFIYEAPRRRDGRYAGFVELSLDIFFERLCTAWGGAVWSSRGTVGATLTRMITLDDLHLLDGLKRGGAGASSMSRTQRAAV